MTFINLSGKIFNRLTVIKVLETRPSTKRRYLCKCLCGNFTKVLDYNLKNGAVKSCGCWRKDFSKKFHYKHGHASSKGITTEYRIHRNMLNRCYNKNVPAYKSYGGRGIRVCKRWHTFTNFYKDMGKRPSKKFSLDRIDNNKSYYKANCRWATSHQQGCNTRKTSYFTYKGTTKALSDWAIDLGVVTPRIVFKRLKRGWKILNALTTPNKRPDIAKRSKAA